MSRGPSASTVVYFRPGGGALSTPRTMFEKIWSRHVVAEGPGGHVLLYVDRHLLHEGSTSAFERLAKGRAARQAPGPRDRDGGPLRPHLGAVATDPEILGMVESLGRHTAVQGIVHFGPSDARRGIVHVNRTGAGTDGCPASHSSAAIRTRRRTGAFGALAFASARPRVEHVMTTQTLWQKKPRVMRVTVEGRLGLGVTSPRM